MRMSLAMRQRRARVKSKCLIVGFTLGLSFAFLNVASFVSGEERPFYHGKTLNIVVGYPPGGGYDLYTRVLARHLAKYIPGEPMIVVRNVPGAGSRVALNQLYARTKPDGLTIATFDRDAYSSQLLKHEGIQYDLRKLSWIGSMSSELSVLQVRADTGIRSASDLLRLKSPLVVGSTAVGSSPYVQARGLETGLGLQLKHATGYRGSGDVAAALERGEVQALVGSITSLRTLRPHWLEQGLIRIIVQVAVERGAELPDVPAGGELARDEKGRQLIAAAAAGNQWARPYAGPPGVQAHRLEILRKAFAETLKDQQFLKDAKKLGIEIESPMSAGELEKMLKQVLDMPADVLEQFSRLFQ